VDTSTCVGDTGDIEEVAGINLGCETGKRVHLEGNTTLDLLQSLEELGRLEEADTSCETGAINERSIEDSA
jgi:hypothetical protein